MTSDFGITRYCKKCGLEIINKGEVVTMTADSKFCECNKEKTTEKELKKEDKLEIGFERIKENNKNRNWNDSVFRDTIVEAFRFCCNRFIENKIEQGRKEGEIKEINNQVEYLRTLLNCHVRKDKGIIGVRRELTHKLNELKELLKSIEEI